VTEDVGDDVFAPPRANLEVREGPEVLWEMPFKEVRKLYLASLNIRALGILYFIAALGGIALTVTSGLALFAGGGGSRPAVVPSLLMLSFTGVTVAAWITSYTRPRWGRVVGVIICAISLINIPIGTVIGILGLASYAQGGKLFGPGRLLHKDLSAVYRQRKDEK
jgi:hypothetical protein